MSDVTRGTSDRPRWPAPLVFAAFAAVAVAADMEALAARTVAMARPCDPAACPSPLLNATAATQLAAAGFSLSGYAAMAALLSALLIALLLGLGGLIALRGSGNRRWAIGAVWIAMSFGSVSSFSSWPWAVHTITPLGLIGLFWLIALFPTMDLTPRWAAVPASIAGAWAVVTFGVPAIASAIAQGDSPWYQIVGPVFTLCVAALAVAQVVRFRRAGRDTRRAQGQLVIALGLMLVAGAAGALLAFSPQSSGPGTLAGSLSAQASNLVTGVLLLVFAGAALRDGAYGVRSAVDNVLFGSVLLAAAAAVYLATALIASQLLVPGPTAAVAAIATALVLATLFQPLREGISRLVYGAQDAGTVVGALTASLAGARSAARVVPDLLEELKARMRWPAAHFVADGVDVAASDEVSQRVAAVQLVQGGRVIGTLTVGLRPGQRRPTRRDRVTLEATAGAFAAALAMMRLTESAESARRDVVATRERERASLGRRLHDGVGPGLAVARHLIQATRDDISPTASQQRTLATADRALDDALTQIRKLSRDLRPPTLDELGLGPALVAFARDLGLAATLEAAADIDAADETRIALFRVGVEALVNAARHGSAATVAIGIRLGADELEMTIDDDGTGIPTSAPPGVGIAAMRSRADELGGSISIEPRGPRGTRVAVRLPVVASGSPFAVSRGSTTVIDAHAGGAV